MRPITMRSLAVALVLGCLLSGCTSPSDSGEEPTAPASAQEPEPTDVASPGVEGVTTDDAWRTEVWRDVQLEVPSGWGLGYAPMADGDEVMLCGTGPLEGTARGPYVGRPGYGSDACLIEDLVDVGLDRAGVWFGSVLPVGDAIAKTGLHQVTVEAGRSRVTVASKDDAVLRRILDSVEVVREDANGCPARLRPTDAMSIEGWGNPTHLSVCLYDTGGRVPVREWSERQPRDVAEELVAALEDRAGEGCLGRCLPPCHPVGQVVLLRVHGEDMYGDDIPRDFVVTLGRCPTLEVFVEGRVLRLTRDLVQPWASAGVATYVLDPSGRPGLTGYFRPSWG